MRIKTQPSKDYHDSYSNHFALRMSKKGACPAEAGGLTPVFEKSATELKLKQKLKHNTNSNIQH